MAEIASALVSLIPSARGFGPKMEREIGGETKTAGKKLGIGFGKTFAAAGGLLAAAGIGSFLKDSIGEAREAQKVGALTESIIKSTGGAAKISAAQVGELAGAISAKTGVDDEAIQSGANLLLTFKNVRNEVGEGSKIFNRATRAASDLSAAGFGDLNGASKQLGKALNDPLKGITALSRSGVTFTEQQKEQIKTLVESGDTLKAQKIILGEVESQVGGAAAASATAGEKAGVAFGNLKEQLGTALLPAVDAVANAFLGFAPALSRGIEQIGPLFKSLTRSAMPLIAALRDSLQPAIEQVFGFFRANPKVLAVVAGGLLALVSPVAAVAVGLALLYAKSETFREVFAKVISGLQAFGTQAAPAVGKFLTGLKDALLPVLRTVGTTFQSVILPAIVSFAAYVTSSLLPVMAQVWQVISSRVLPIASSLAQFFVGTLVPAVARIAGAVASNLKPVFDQLVATFQAKVLPAISKLLATFQKYQPTIQKVIGVVVRVIGKVLEFAAAILGKVLPPAIRFAGFLSGTIISAVAGAISVIAKIISTVINFGKTVIDGARRVGEFAKRVGSGVEKVVRFFIDLPGKVLRAIGELATKLYNAGTELMSKLAQGIKDKVEDVLKPVRDVAGKIKDLFPGSPVKEGPLRSFNGGHAGRELMNMLARGISSGANVVARESTKVAASIRRLLSKGADRGFIKKLSDDLVIDWAKVVGLKGKKADKAFDQIRDRLERALGRLKDSLQRKIDSVQKTLDDMTSFAASVSSAFKVDLFSGSLTDLFRNGFANNATLKAVIAGFKKLVGAGYDKGFLSQLIQSGNGALIIELANADPKTVAQAQDVFGQQSQLTSQLGTFAAEFNSGRSFKGVEDRLDTLNAQMRDLPKNIGQVVGKSLRNEVVKGKRNQRKGGKAA
ncbi:hypothetical protein [Nocardioides lianchengensis]|uniref:Phage-related protein n=1 Tax=Nocardioides lianchengensis TaxID=1045774 RepID=A0A1G6YHY4_9ACTN|nr:hypothetical protein [Nocardioides lianchengensis]NYG09636.1 phage-related protein [Nocardioides lianchengensis]SDD89999.1 Phage-related protein [Nocardioides lianchengensis]